MVQHLIVHLKTANRGSEEDTLKNEVIHRFLYGAGRLSVHEVWISYSYSEHTFNKPVFTVLGW